jgi:transcriptional regulator with PAS, ATPase and Fis domain
MLFSSTGNVRELEHAIDRATGLGMTAYILPKDLPEAITAGTPEVAEVNVWTQEVTACKKAIIERALRKTGGNRNEAAALLGLHPTYFASCAKS